MKVLEITFFVDDATRIAHRVEKIAYGYEYRGKRVAGKVNADDLEAIEVVNEAIDIVYSCRGEAVSIELPTLLARELKRYLGLYDSQEESEED